MDAWDNFFCILGKIFFVILVGVLTAALLYPINKWMDRANEPAKEIQPKVYPLYDSKGRPIERKLVEGRNGK